MIHFFVGSHVKKPKSGLFSDWIGNNTDDLRCSDWPKCRHPLVTSAEREVKDSRRSGMYQSCNFLTRLGKQSL